MSQTPVRVAALCGPTAIGKTAAAVALVEAHGLPIEIIGFDALQVYQGLHAGTAKPTAQERASVAHHCVDLVPPDQPMSAGRFVELAGAAVADTVARGKWPLLVGGTGLYLSALVRGLADIPPVPEETRQRLARQWQQDGPEALHARLARVDPAYAAATPAANRQRVLRALEVFEATGRPFSAWHEDGRQRAAGSGYACWLALVDPEREERCARIDRRAQAMAEPLWDEVAALLAGGLSPHAPAMQALGYREAARRQQLGLSPAGFGAALAASHRQYARRQLTWFRAMAPQSTLADLSPGSVTELASALSSWFS